MVDSTTLPTFEELAGQLSNRLGSTVSVDVLRAFATVKSDLHEIVPGLMGGVHDDSSSSWVECAMETNTTQRDFPSMSTGRRFEYFYEVPGMAQQAEAHFSCDTLESAVRSALVGLLSLHPGQHYSDIPI